MCGRYFIPAGEDEIKEIIGILQRKYGENQDKPVFPAGEIFPTDATPVLTAKGYILMKWGFSGIGGKPVINARIETAHEKPMFSRSFAERRCLVPAGNYFEWKNDGKTKIKHSVSLPGKPVLYMAGIYRNDPDSDLPVFVILTRPASESLNGIHDRMPVILPKNLHESWLSGSPEIGLQSIGEVKAEESASQNIQLSWDF